MSTGLGTTRSGRFQGRLGLDTSSIPASLGDAGQVSFSGHSPHLQDGSSDCRLPAGPPARLPAWANGAAREISTTKPSGTPECHINAASLYHALL